MKAATSKQCHRSVSGCNCFWSVCWTRKTESILWIRTVHTIICSRSSLFAQRIHFTSSRRYTLLFLFPKCHALAIAYDLSSFLLLHLLLGHFAACTLPPKLIALKCNPFGLSNVMCLHREYFCWVKWQRVNRNRFSVQRFSKRNLSLGRDSTSVFARRIHTDTCISRDSKSYLLLKNDPNASFSVWAEDNVKSATHFSLSVFHSRNLLFLLFSCAFWTLEWCSLAQPSFMYF